MSDVTREQGGHLTAAVVERLRPSLPALAAEPDLTAITPQRVFGLITVEALWIIIDRTLRERAS